MIRIFIICIVLVCMSFTTGEMPMYNASYRFGNIHNIDKKDFMRRMNLYPFEFHKSKTGLIGNLYNRIVVTNADGDVWYKYPQTIPKHIRYPPYHTSGAGKHNAVELLFNKDFYYYIRYGAATPFFTEYLRNFLPNTPGREPTMCLVSRKRTITNLHNDNGERWQYLLFGKKKWIIIDKKFRKEMGFFEEEGKPSRSITFTQKIHEKDIPVPYKTFITTPGSLIYLPANWLHYVETLEDVTVSVNFKIIT